MVQRILATTVAALLLLATPAVAQSQRGVGTKAPKLVNLEWLRGKPIKQFKRGTTYVLYFWATSAQNCARTLPLLEESLAEHSDQRVALIGINIWPRPDSMPVETFLEKREGFMDFPIARDILDKTAKEWNKLVDLTSVPYVVIINRVGKIEWAGHPFDGADVALRAVLDGDKAALKVLVAERNAVHDKADELTETIQKSWSSKWWNKTPGHVDELIALDERLYGPWASWKYEALVFDGKHEDAAAYGRDIVDRKIVSCESTLNKLAWFIVNPRGKVRGEDRDVELALRFAQFANELSGGRDSGVLGTLARAHFLSGDTEGALDLQTLAVQESFSSKDRKALAKTLEEYQAGTEQPISP